LSTDDQIIRPDLTAAHNIHSFIPPPPMGNTVIIPPVHDWYTHPLKKQGITVINALDCGTFFIVLQGRSQIGQEVIIKCYQYYQPLMQVPAVSASVDYFNDLERQMAVARGVVPYAIRQVNENSVFLVRKKLERSLLEFASYQEPRLQMIEKEWIFYQLVTATMGLHIAELAHGDIKPSNVFVSQSLTVALTDPAPFKPQRIHPNRPHLFYHFFTTSADSGCCIAPERISSDESTAIDLKAADWFSVGCVGAYLFLGGRHLFDLAGVSSYSKGEFDVDSELAVIGNERVVSALRGFLDVDPVSRNDAALDFYRCSPKYFQSIQRITGKWDEQRENGVLEFHPMLETMLASPEAIPAEGRLLVYNHIKEEIWRRTSVPDLVLGIEKVVEFMLPCDDEVKLVRIIPVMLTFANSKPAVLMRAAIFAVLDLMKGVKEVAPELDGYFEYLRKHLYSIAMAPDSQNNPNVQFIFVEFLPLLVIELLRIDRKKVKSFVLGFTKIFTQNDIELFKVFAETLRSVQPLGRAQVLKAFLYPIVVVLNYPPDEFPLEILQILITFYSDGTRSEIRRYAKQCHDTVLPFCNDIAARGDSEQLHIRLFEFMEVLLRQKIVHSTVAFEWAAILTRFANSANAIVQYWVFRLVHMFPEKARSRFSLAFVFEAPQKGKSLSRFPGNKAVPAAKDEKLIAFEYTRKTQFRPRFLSSSHVPGVRIAHIFGTTRENQFMVVDRRGEIRSVALPGEQRSVFEHCILGASSEPPVSGCSVTGDSAFVLGFASGKMNRYDIEQPSPIQIGCLSSPNFATSMSPLSENSILVGSTDGSASFFDFRATDTGPSCSIACLGSSSAVSAIAVWPSSHVLAGLGSLDGVVTLLDLRMWIPIWSEKTTLVSGLVPLGYETPALSYLVMSRDWIEIVTEPRAKPQIRPRNVVRGHLGGAFRVA
jgi:serine/threonine protein kinase